MKTDNSITLHDGHATVNVKVRECWKLDATDEIRERAYDLTVEQFWRDATEAAHKRGYSGIFSEGRSDGWCTPYYQYVAGKVAQFQNWPGQGGTNGYPQYPDVEHSGAERERFRGFQRDIRKLLVEAPNEFRHFGELEMEAV